MDKQDPHIAQNRPPKLRPVENLQPRPGQKPQPGPGQPPKPGLSQKALPGAVQPPQPGPVQKTLPGPAQAPQPGSAQKSLPSRPGPPRRQPPAKRPVRPSQPRSGKAWPWAQILSTLVLACLILGVLAMGFSLFLKARYEVDIVNLDTAAVKKRDAVLVLGCGVYADGSPTPMLRDRMNAGITAYFKGAGQKLLLSGDHGQKNYDEVNAMKQLALEAGVPEEDIFLDHAGFSTYESLKRGKEIFGLQSVCLISQKYHLYRACYLADSLGLDYCGYPADAYAYGGQFLREAREVLARVKAFFSATFQPQPEVLGPAIDITGDGRASWD